MKSDVEIVDQLRDLKSKVQRGEIKLKEPNWFQHRDWFEIAIMSFLGFVGLAGAAFVIGLLILFFKLVIWVWSL